VSLCVFVRAASEVEQGRIAWLSTFQETDAQIRTTYLIDGTSHTSERMLEPQYPTSSLCFEPYVNLDIDMEFHILLGILFEGMYGYDKIY
jgi:hypothetical protein